MPPLRSVALHRCRRAPPLEPSPIASQICGARPSGDAAVEETRHNGSSNRTAAARSDPFGTARLRSLPGSRNDHRRRRHADAERRRGDRPDDRPAISRREAYVPVLAGEPPGSRVARRLRVPGAIHVQGRTASRAGRGRGGLPARADGPVRHRAGDARDLVPRRAQRRLVARGADATSSGSSGATRSTRIAAWTPCAISSARSKSWA